MAMSIHAAMALLSELYDVTCDVIAPSQTFSHFRLKSDVVSFFLTPGAGLCFSYFTCLVLIITLLSMQYLWSVYVCACVKKIRFLKLQLQYSPYTYRPIYQQHHCDCSSVANAAFGNSMKGFVLNL